MITVNAVPAQLYPAVDEGGQFDEPATWAAAEHLLAEVRAELEP